MYKIGDKITIIRVNPKASMDYYNGRSGVITHIGSDPWGATCLYGTWGGCSLHIGEDIIKLEVVDK